MLFRWEVDPSTRLYKKNEFTMTFPATVNLSRVPVRAWPLIAMICLHPHWILLRPCRVELPFQLDPGEEEFWYRMMDALLGTMEAHAGRTECARTVEFSCSGTFLPEADPLADSGRCATAFSGGKDSLLQTGILCELTEKPLLVATTSPLPPFEDHSTERRRYVFREIVERRNVELVEVISDFRSITDNTFSYEVKPYTISVSELTDTLLYFSVLLATSLAMGVPHLFLASESEIQECTEYHGRIVQHIHVMYTAATVRTLSTLLAPLGITACSMTSPLFGHQVHRLLWSRYKDLRDLQYSCWMTKETEAECSQCTECLRYAFGAMAFGSSPAAIGIELGKVVRAMKDWTPPKADALTSGVVPPVGIRSSFYIVELIRATTILSFLKAFAKDAPAELFSRQGWKAVMSFRRLRRRMKRHSIPSSPGYRAGYLQLVDPLLRDSVGSIYAQYFSPEPDENYRAILERSMALSAGVTETLRASEVVTR